MRTHTMAVLLLVSAACSGPPREAAEPHRSSAPLALIGTVWNLVELDGKSGATGQGGKPATLELTAEGTRASGFAGCNRMAGTYDLQGDKLRLGPLALTRMACESGMELEQAYVEALNATRTFTVSSTGLELAGESGPVARFEAQ